MKAVAPIQLGPGYTRAFRIGAATVFIGEDKTIVPKVLGADGVLHLMTKQDWRAMKAAEDKRRERAARNKKTQTG